MQLFRSKLINSGQDHHKKILSSSDFYSLSELRDLLFHIQEHRFTLPQIRQCLDDLGLEFCGFENKDMVRRFKSRFRGDCAIYDLDKWSIFEDEFPDTFSGMYQFWCQKIV